MRWRNDRRMGGIAVVFSRGSSDGRCGWISSYILLELKWWASHACIYRIDLARAGGSLYIHDASQPGAATHIASQSAPGQPMSVGHPGRGDSVCGYRQLISLFCSSRPTKGPESEIMLPGT